MQFPYYSLDIMKHLTIFTTFEFKPFGEGVSNAISYFGACAHATLELTREDFD